MNKNIEHYIFHKKNFLDEKYCENSINELNESDWKKHTWYTPKTDLYESKDNDSEQLEAFKFTLDVQKINDFIIQGMQSTISEYLNTFKFDWFKVPLEFNGSAMKFIRYSPGQTMQTHCDHIHDLFDGERRGIPILSVIGILNDDYEGGELIMCEDKKIDTKKGDLLIFPSNFLYPHEITPVTKGVRYSYVSWLW
jgi:predicted 2-oxoglutarate/Fe(II)-dependent dioxygenase YbiX